MTIQSIPNKSVVSLALILAYSYMITMNSLANALPINGITTGELSDRISNYFVPYGGTFAIWGPIFLLLLATVIQQVYSITKNKAQLKSSFYLILSANLIGNGTWILAWHYEYFALSVLIMLGILLSLISLHNSIYKVKSHWLAKITISTYLGWISVATVANITAFLVSLDWHPSNEILYASGMIFIVTVLTFIILWRKKDIIFSLVIVWAFYGITQSQPDLEFLQSGSIAFYAYIVILLGILLASFLRLRKA